MIDDPLVGGGEVHRRLPEVTVAEQERPPIELFDFAGIARGGLGQAWPILAMCSYCQAVRYPLALDAPDDAPRDWISAEDYYHRGGDARVRLSHGVCPPCFEDLDRALPH